jgi:hypothetical protein
MQDILTVALPRSASKDEAAALEIEMKRLAGVEDGGLLQPRGLGPAEIQIWLQVASGVLALVGTAVPLLQKILGLVRQKGIRGTRLRIGNSELEVDHMSIADLESLVARMKAA